MKGVHLVITNLCVKKGGKHMGNKKHHRDDNVDQIIIKSERTPDDDIASMTSAADVLKALSANRKKTNLKSKKRGK